LMEGIFLNFLESKIKDVFRKSHPFEMMILLADVYKITFTCT